MQYCNLRTILCKSMREITARQCLLPVNDSHTSEHRQRTTKPRRVAIHNCMGRIYCTQRVRSNRPAPMHHESGASAQAMPFPQGSWTIKPEDRKQQSTETNSPNLLTLNRNCIAIPLSNSHKTQSDDVMPADHNTILYTTNNQSHRQSKTDPFVVCWRIFSTIRCRTSSSV